MSDASMAMADGGPDDLPRSFRRERDAQREARERDARERAAADQAYAPLPEPTYDPEPPMASFGVPSQYPLAQPNGIVTAIQVPFASLVAFFLKAVLAAVPALFLLGFLLWGAGQVMTAYFPWLLKMKILITFPN
jgi:hypothetical protein